MVANQEENENDSDDCSICSSSTESNGSGTKRKLSSTAKFVENKRKMP